MGLSPYEKKSYRESKKRRRQALLASETGYIKPYKRRRKPSMILSLIIIFCLIVGTAAAVTLVCRNQPEQKTQEISVALTDDQLLQIVNKQHSLDTSYVPALADFGGVLVHAAIVDNLTAWFDAAQEQGIELKINYAYVSYEHQQKLFEENLSKFTSDPAYTPVRAQAAAQKIVPEAGCSESQTGLLLDFDISDIRTKAFIERECIRYGFVLRYPEGKDELTHIAPSPSLYRYVGVAHAEKMRAFDMCLEEYTNYLDKG